MTLLLLVRLLVAVAFVLLFLVCVFAWALGCSERKAARLKRERDHARGLYRGELRRANELHAQLESLRPKELRKRPPL